MSTLITDQLTAADTLRTRDVQAFVEGSADVMFAYLSTSALRGNEVGVSSITDNGTGDNTLNLSVTYNSPTEREVVQARPHNTAGVTRISGGSTTTIRLLSFSLGSVATDMANKGYCKGELA